MMVENTLEFCVYTSLCFLKAKSQRDAANGQGAQCLSSCSNDSPWGFSGGSFYINIKWIIYYFILM